VTEPALELPVRSLLEATDLLTEENEDWSAGDTFILPLQLLPLQVDVEPLLRFTNVVVQRDADFVNCTFTPSGSVINPATESLEPHGTETVEITVPSGSDFFVIVGRARRLPSSSSNTSAAWSPTKGLSRITNQRMREKRENILFFIGDWN
jgi:hypothetical protein